LANCTEAYWKRYVNCCKIQQLLLFLENESDIWHVLTRSFEGDLEKGKRVLAYALRTLVLCIQILQHQCVRDFTSGNYYWTMLQGVYDTQWQAYVDLCGPHWKQLLLDFITLCHNMSKNKNQHMMNWHLTKYQYVSLVFIFDLS
jgi:hypothetical protein